MHRWLPISLTGAFVMGAELVHVSALTARNSPFPTGTRLSSSPSLFSNLSEAGDYVMPKSSKDPKPGHGRSGSFFTCSNLVMM